MTRNVRTEPAAACAIVSIRHTATAAVALCGRVNRYTLPYERARIIPMAIKQYTYNSLNGK